MVVHGFEGSEQIPITNSDADFSITRFVGAEWSLAPLQESGSAATHPEHAKKIAQALYSIGAHHAYAPSPIEFNGKIVRPQELDVRIPIGNSIGVSEIALYRNPAKPADGTLLSRPGDAGIMSAGGCPIIVATYEEQCVFAHAGRDCLFDRTYFISDGKKKGREHESVVDSIFGALEAKHASEVRVWVFGSIRPEDFIHPFGNERHGDHNAKLYHHLRRYYPGDCFMHDQAVAVYPDLPRIIREQFVRRGAELSQISLSSAYLPADVSRTFRGGSTARYLMAVVRRS